MLHIAERPQQRGRNAGAALRRGAVQRRLRGGDVGASDSQSGGLRAVAYSPFIYSA